MFSRAIARGSHLSVATLSAVTLASFGAPALAQEASKAAGSLPAVEVKQAPAKANPTSKPVAAKKTAPTAPSAAAPQPQASAPQTASSNASASSADGVVAPGTRSGSLGVPTTAEARADIQRTPGGVDIVSDQEYKNSTPATTIKDALDYVPGVFVQPKWGDDTRLSIRGSGLSRNFHGRGVFLLMDGTIPISTADGASDFQEIDPTAYRYIEVYKGANALRYGANQLGGAINFVMPTGYDADLFGTRIDVGSFGFHKLAMSSGGVSGPADYFITGTWQEQEGFRDHSDGESVRGAMNIGYRFSSNLETRFYLNANHVRQRIPGAVNKGEALGNPEGAFERTGTPVTFSGIGNDNVDRDYQRNLDTLRVANRTTMRVAPGTVVEVGGFYFDRHLDHPIFAVVDNEHDEAGAFARLVDEGRIGGIKNRLTAGVSYTSGDVRARLFKNNLGVKGDLFSDADQSSVNTIVYAENSFYVLPQLALVAGMQHVSASRKLDDRFLSNGDQSGSANYQFWSPKAGIVWDVTPTAQIFANVSKSGETPTFSEITITSIATTSLKVQEAVTYEIGTRGGTEGFKWDLALYRANLDNEFQCLSTGALGTCTQVNLDKSIHQGVELGIQAALLQGLIARGPSPDKLWLNAAYTFNDFRFDGDAKFGNNELPGAPRHFLRAELLYKHPFGVYAGPNVEWVPQAFYVDSANTFQTEAYAIWGAKLGFDNGGPITAYLEGRNLSDEHYIASASIATTANASSTLFEPGNGRAVYGGVQVKW